MFFVRKDNIGTILGTQKEHAAAGNRGVAFFAGPAIDPAHRVWHYLWPADKIEPSIRASVRLPGTVAALAAPAAQPDEDQIVGQEIPVGSNVHRLPEPDE